jgi:hypothetical protein
MATALTQAACGDDDNPEPARSPAATATPTAPQAAQTAPERTNDMKVAMTFEDTELTATLIDSPTARDFLALLPLELTLTDYAEAEKISDLPRRLSTADAPDGVDPAVGDITYFAPWGNLAIFHRDFDHSTGLVKLGSIDSGAEALARMDGDVTVTIQRAHDARS